MSYIYRLKIDVIKVEDECECTVFGIEAVKTDGEILMSVSDLFFNIEDARVFVGKCNRNKLSLIHLADAIDDVLTELYS